MIFSILAFMALILSICIKDRKKSLYCNKNYVYDAFEELINKANAKYVIIIQFIQKLEK